MRKWMDKGGAKAERGYPGRTRGTSLHLINICYISASVKQYTSLVHLRRLFLQQQMTKPIPIQTVLLRQSTKITQVYWCWEGGCFFAAESHWCLSITTLYHILQMHCALLLLCILNLTITQWCHRWLEEMLSRAQFTKYKLIKNAG